jgi:hypothetical protein
MHASMCQSIMGNLFFFPFHSTCRQCDFGNGARRRRDDDSEAKSVPFPDLQQADTSAGRLQAGKWLGLCGDERREQLGCDPSVSGVAGYRAESVGNIGRKRSHERVRLIPISCEYRMAPSVFGFRRTNFLIGD